MKTAPMRILPVSSPAFSRYGEVLEGYGLSELTAALRRETPMPASGFVYLASSPVLESLPVFASIRDRAFGGMPVQMGYCNGRNSRLGCLEYHKSSEVLVAASPLALLLGCRADIADGRYDASRAEAFLVPAGTCLELYAGTLHYAPCSASPDGFFMACVLPLGTNAPAPALSARTGGDLYLAGRNKWLLAHPDAPEAREGAVPAITGEDLDLSALAVK